VFDGIEFSTKMFHFIYKKTNNLAYENI